MGKWRRCANPQCPTAAIVTGRERCPPCAAEYERTRGTPTQRGYGTEHRRNGDAAIRGATHCASCGQPFTIDNPVQRGHVVPIRDGGTSADGYVAHCTRCNAGWRRTGL